MSDDDMQAPAEDPNTGDLAKDIMVLYLNEVKRRLLHEARDLKAADFEHLRKLMQDNSITISSVRRGDFGEFAKKVAEESDLFNGPDDEGDGGPVFN